MISAERLERISLLKKQVELIKQNLSGKQHELVEYYNVLKEIERIQRIEDCYQDVMKFATTYFTGEPPHDILKADTPSPKFHYELTEYLREAVLDPDARRVAICAPRSHAKSSIVTAIFIIWCLVYVEDVKERYWVIISDKQDNAKRFLDVIKAELEDNQLLVDDFGSLKGNTWNSLEIITKNSVKVSAHGALEGLRGMKYGSFRPSVVIDDMESDESVSTPERINKMMDYFDRTILPLGDPKHSKYFFVGTILHYNSVLNQVMTNRPDWEALKFRAIEAFPTRMDLWNKWEEMYHDRTQGNDPIEASRLAYQNAKAFYEANKEEMHKGSKILWKERLDLRRLMEIRATKRLAFNSEYQNEPIDSDTAIFHKIHYYEPDDVRLDEMEIFGACDPSLGQTKRSDPSAIVTVGRHKKTGIIYVLDVDVKRRTPDQTIQDIFKKTQLFTYTKFSIETVAFQQFMKTELTKRSAEQGIYLPIVEFKSTVKKEARISAMEPMFTSGYIRILATHKALEEELMYFPRFWASF